MASSPASILILDEAAEDTEQLIRQLGNLALVRVVPGGEYGLSAALDDIPDLILINDGQPDNRAFSVCKALGNTSLLSGIPIVILTDKPYETAYELGMRSGANDCLIKPVRTDLLKMRLRKHLAGIRYQAESKERRMLLETELVRKGREVTRMQEFFVIALSSIAETRDNETGHHIERTRMYVSLLARELKAKGPASYKLSESEIRLITKSAPLHDIGKIGIPDHILLKQGALNRDEFNVIKTHTTIGLNALLRAERMMGKSQPFLHHAKDIVNSHHERWDGTGYPKGLKGDEIPLSARLMALADVYDALISHRVYKNAMSHETARSIILESSGVHFDPLIVATFMDLEQRFRIISERYRDL